MGSICWKYQLPQGFHAFKFNKSQMTFSVGRDDASALTVSMMGKCGQEKINDDVFLVVVVSCVFSLEFFSSTMMRLLVQFARLLPKIPHRSFSDLKVRSTAASGSQVYDTERAVHEYLLLHYGNARDEKLLMPYDFGPVEALNFPRRSVDLTFKHATHHHHHSCERPLRALDVGCSVGGTTFELSRKFEVVGIDYSQHFIDAANTMKNFGSMEFEVLKQGKIYQKNCLATLKPECNASRVTFQQGDACQLKESLGVLFSCNFHSSGK